MPLLAEQATLFTGARYEDDIEFVSFIATTEAAPELAPPGGCVLECFAFLRPAPPGLSEAGLWPPGRAQQVARLVVAAVQRTLETPLQIEVMRVRSPADLAQQVRPHTVAMQPSTVRVALSCWSATHGPRPAARSSTSTMVASTVSTRTAPTLRCTIRGASRGSRVST